MNAPQPVYSRPCELFRANVASTRHGCEFVVFYEAGDLDRLDHVEHLMCLLWATVPEDLEITNIHSEAELLNGAAFSGNEGGDLRLFETGWYLGPLYALPALTLILTTPITARRLHALQLQTQQPLIAQVAL